MLCDNRYLMVIYSHIRVGSNLTMLMSLGFEKALTILMFKSMIALSWEP